MLVKSKFISLPVPSKKISKRIDGNPGNQSSETHGTPQKKQIAWVGIFISSSSRSTACCAAAANLALVEPWKNDGIYGKMMEKVETKNGKHEDFPHPTIRTSTPQSRISAVNNSDLDHQETKDQQKCAVGHLGISSSENLEMEIHEQQMFDTTNQSGLVINHEHTCVHRSL